MSGKPATPAVSRAGVPGAPRLLVYVADPRQLESAAAAPDAPPHIPLPALDSLFLNDNLNQHITLPKTTVYRSQIDQSDQRNLQNTIFYQPNDNAVIQPHEFHSLNRHQQFPKDSYSNVDDKINEQISNILVKKDHVQSAIAEDNTLTGAPLDPGDLGTYQTQCSGAEGSDHAMPSIQSVGVRHGIFHENSTIQSGERKNCGDSEISVDKSYMNYQFLEQSVSHQSIVNQSISILNQQIGVNRGIISECESGNVPQLVRTADGVVLAVLPSSTVPQPTELSDQNSLSTNSDPLQTITVPLGWRRIVTGTSVCYISPSGSAVSTLSQLRDYLQTTGTCKCGLPCPLRPETAFSFDPKVISKPYQAASGAELTKLCNHKRKLLATLQARSLSPVTPPPQHIEQKKGTEAVKKKMKKRTSFPSNMSMSQLMVQRERPLSEFKVQEMETVVRPTSTSVKSQQRNNCSPGPSGTPSQQLTALNNIVSQDNDVKQETYVQKSSHYLTVNSGWITQQQENLDIGQKQNQIPPGTIGLPVLGTNGQIIGVNTGFNKNSTNFRNVINVPSQSYNQQDSKDDKKHNIHPSQQNISIKQSLKDEESQIFCGLNQPLTPEVMQKINEQQQLFIQQNQKQIEMAMKGFRNQSSENKSQNQFVSQAQLVIQNGAVVKTNPAKTPPWQVKKPDTISVNPIESPSHKVNKQDMGDYEEMNTNLPEEFLNTNNTFSNEQSLSVAMCSRVPPLPQHYNMMNQQWPVVDFNKKKNKGNKATKKKTNCPENKILTFGNNGVRIVQESKTKNCDDIPNNNVPSFMDDPNGFLAQQTVLLNNTISRQVNAAYNNQYENSSSNYNQNQIDKSCKLVSKNSDNVTAYKCNTAMANPLSSPNNIPDSSVLSEKTDNTSSQCCKGCSGMKDYPEQHNMKMKFVRQHSYKNELDVNPIPASPLHGFEENPISSTFMERHSMSNDHCGPIQAGTVSTSDVSPVETLQLPEPSPTPSNSSRSTDTPHSSGSNSSQQQFNCAFPLPSPANSVFGNPPTPGNQFHSYNSPGPPNNALITGTQMMHFISNHNVNKNLMEVDNISMVGVKPGLKTPQEYSKSESRKRFDNVMPGYCPPPHLGGGPSPSLVHACYVQTYVTTMASGFSVTRDTVTSVLAGKANTATTSINTSQANFIRPPPPPSINLATSYAIPTNQPDPFLNSVNLPTSYPLHIAGTTAQNMITKSPLEMVQNVIGSPTKTENGNTMILPQNRRICQSTAPGQILISSTGQIIVSNSQMPPPPPKMATTTSLQVSTSVTNINTTITQGAPTMASVQSIVNPPAVVVNTLPTPFVIQPPMVAVDQVMQQNTVLPQIVNSGIIPGQSSNENSRHIEVKSNQNLVQGVAMLSPESLKKRSKKKKNQTANVTNVLHITAPQQNTNNIMMQHTSPQHSSSPQFSPRGYQLSPNNNISSAPMLQALTIVPGKSGTPAHIVMNGQGNSNNFNSQQIIANTSPSQQINLLQPVNLINNTNNVMPNFQTFQQFIVPNLGGMVMTADGTAIIQDNSSGMPMQLQLQTLNGQNVLTPVQNPGVFTAGNNSSVVIRAQNQQGKIIQSQHSPGAQFLSPNSQVMMSSPNFNGQLSPLLANLSPNNVTFNTSPHQVRSSNIQTQDFIQTNQIGQALMVPLSPKQVSIASATGNRSNSTLVQQNTTIVQQQTTLVSNSHNPQISSITTNIQGGNSSRLSIDPNVLLVHKQHNSHKGRNLIEMVEIKNEEAKDNNKHPVPLEQPHEGEMKGCNPEHKLLNDFDMMSGQGCSRVHVRHSVSTQTLVNQRGKSPGGACSGCSPPDTTTHSPLGALGALGALGPEGAGSPRHVYSAPAPTHRTLADTTTNSPEPADTTSSAMVQCVSSSEQDMAEAEWPRREFSRDADLHNLMPNLQMVRQNRMHNPVETTELQYSHNLNPSSVNPQNVLPISSQNYYDRNQAYKRKNEFNDESTYRGEKMMRGNNYVMVHGLQKDTEYDNCPDKSQLRHYMPSGSSSDNSQSLMERHNLGPGGDGKNEERIERERGEGGERKFEVGELVWGPVKGYASWPGALVGGAGAGLWRVRWFGREGGAAGVVPAASVVPAARLLSLSEGLEAHHAARTKHRKSRKLNTLLENAIQEAMSELDKKCETKGEEGVASTSVEASEASEVSEVSVVTNTPKRSRKDKPRNKDKSKKNTSKVTSGLNKTLRSSR